jgi:choline dehydrogenase
MNIDRQSNTNTEETYDRVRNNQQRLRAEMKPSYDFIVCGAGSSGSVVARRLAENPDVEVLLIEAGGSDDVPEVMEAIKWPLNRTSERNWGFHGQPSRYLNGRSIPLHMGKVLGGGSSINAMVWVRGHKNDWDFFAAEADDEGWSYESVLSIYRTTVEDWHGSPDHEYRGTGGMIFVQPPQNPNPIAPAMVEGAQSVGIPSSDGYNGRVMEGDGGTSLIELCLRDGRRQSVFRSYVFPLMDRQNLTVLSRALVTRVNFEGKRATGVEVTYDGITRNIRAVKETILSLGAIQTPKLLMQSGIGDEAHLGRHGITVVQHLPGVGRSFQDHVRCGRIWEYQEHHAPRNNAAEATFFWKSHASLDVPDIQAMQVEVPFLSVESQSKFNPPAKSWTLLPSVVHPQSRGYILLTGPKPLDPVEIHDNLLSHPDDMKAMKAGLELCREIGNSAALRPYVKREVMPGNLKGIELETFIRGDATTYSHEACTAKMGRDSMSVVDGRLKIYGIDNLRIADCSIMPRVTAGNTMAPCVIIGERAGQILKADHNL